ncbi:hypothetical protein NVP2275O_015 [Vibrio phage 2.275.O._10N.286.54.E11]|nr:hypothetical protein NVP2275O_015 [Vibrio phage 2.275.O._10N.286.54.E11]
MDKDFKGHIERLPFITVGTFADTEYIGIVQVRSKQFTSMFVLNDITDPEDKKKLLKLGEKWWWQSNRNIPITLFMSEEMECFKKYLKTFQSKDFNIQAGPVVSISSLPTKRIKRRNTCLKPNNHK